MSTFFEADELASNGGIEKLRGYASSDNEDEQMAGLLGWFHLGVDDDLGYGAPAPMTAPLRALVCVAAHMYR